MPNDPEKAAQMTNNHFCALARHLNEEAMTSDAAALTAIKSPVCDVAVVNRCCLNGWNSEKVLRLNLQNFNPPDLNCCVHWALPQAYYSVFCMTLALFNTIGRNETSHKAVIKYFGMVAEAGNRFPDRMNFHATGTPNNIQTFGVSKTPGGHTIHYDKSTPASIENQIAQFLTATRKKRLEFIKGRDFKKAFKTKRGKNLKSFREPEWEAVASSIGPTSLLSLLYRKRITANYDDIGTITSDYLDGHKLIEDLIAIVRSCNLTIEHLIYTALGRPDFDGLHKDNSKFDFVLDSRAKLDAA